jgi:cellulose biosynthesis protein BcsQ
VLFGRNQERPLIISIYSAKGGVGKSTLAVNLAWASAALSQRKTLLWDLDAQGAATYMIGGSIGSGRAKRGIVGEIEIDKLIEPTPVEGLSLLPADYSLRPLDRVLFKIGKRKTLARVAANLVRQFDHLIIDCAPGLTDASDQVIRASDMVLVPVIPAPLSRRALDEVKEHIVRKVDRPVILAPVFSMADRRRAIHRSALQQQPGWPIIPMLSAYERVSEERAPIGVLMPLGSPPVRAVADLWKRVESETDAKLERND